MAICGNTIVRKGALDIWLHILEAFFMGHAISGSTLLVEIDLAVATKSIFRIRQLAVPIAFSEYVASHHDTRLR